MVPPEVRELVCRRLGDDTDASGFPVDTGMGAGKIVGVCGALVEQSEFDGAFDGDERGFDDECIEFCIAECVCASE